MQNSFNAPSLKKANIKLEKHLKSVLMYTDIGDKFKDNISYNNEISLWEKLIKLFKND